MRCVRQMLFVALTLGAVLFPREAAALQGWYDNWESAKQVAGTSGKPLVVVFAQEHCPECQKMDRVLCLTGARSALRNAVKVHLEFSDWAQLAHRFSITATPTLLLLPPEAGYQDCLFRQEGAMTLSQITALGRSVDSLASQSHPVENDQEKQASTQRKPEETPPPEKKETLQAKPAPKPLKRTNRSPGEYGYYYYGSSAAIAPRQTVQ